MDWNLSGKSGSEGKFRVGRVMHPKSFVETWIVPEMLWKIIHFRITLSKMNRIWEKHVDQDFVFVGWKYWVDFSVWQFAIFNRSSNCGISFLLLKSTCWDFRWMGNHFQTNRFCPLFRQHMVCNSFSAESVSFRTMQKTPLALSNKQHVRNRDNEGSGRRNLFKESMRVSPSIKRKPCGDIFNYRWCHL